MKTVTPALANHLAAELTSLAYLLKITRRDGVVLGFTTHDRDLVIGAVTYRAASAFSPQAIESRIGNETNAAAVIGLLQADAISEADLLAGTYDAARIDILACNWADLAMGTIQLRRGFIGAVQMRNGVFEAELRGLHELLQQPVGDYFLPECRHNLGDTQCGVNLSSLTVSGSVTTGSSTSLFTDSARSEAAGWFDGGKLTWTSGANSGQAVEVQSYNASKQFQLWLPMPQPIAVGDSYSVQRGCDKRLATCRDVYANVLNFGGFPHLPGVDRIVRYPDARR